MNPKNYKERSISELILWQYHFPDTKCKQRYYQKKKKRILQANITDEHRFKIHQIESSNILKGSYTIIKGDLSQGCKDLISTNQSIWYTTLTNLRIKTMLIISIDAEKAFDKIQHLFVTGKKKKNLSLTKFLHGLFFLMKNFFEILPGERLQIMESHYLYHHQAVVIWVLI